MAFKISDMKDVGKKPKSIASTTPEVKNEIFYPQLRLTSENLKKLENFDFGDDITIHAHGKITGIQQYNKEPKDFTIDFQKMGVKSGHNPSDFNACVDGGGRVRRVSGPDKEHNLSAGQYVNYCYNKKGSHHGEVHSKKSMKKFYKKVK